MAHANVTSTDRRALRADLRLPTRHSRPRSRSQSSPSGCSIGRFAAEEPASEHRSQPRILRTFSTQHLLVSVSGACLKVSTACRPRVPLARTAPGSAWQRGGLASVCTPLAVSYPLRFGSTEKEASDPHVVAQNTRQGTGHRDQAYHQPDDHHDAVCAEHNGLAGRLVTHGNDDASPYAQKHQVAVLAASATSRASPAPGGKKKPLDVCDQAGARHAGSSTRKHHSRQVEEAIQPQPGTACSATTKYQNAVLRTSRLRQRDTSTWFEFLQHPVAG